MKTMTSRQLGGACEPGFQGDTFDEMAELSKKHAMEMIQKNEFAHLEAMRKMRELMKNPAEMNKWFESERKEYKSMPESSCSAKSSRSQNKVMHWTAILLPLHSDK